MSNIIKNFYELDAWKRGHEIVLIIYNVTRDFPKEEQYGVTSQIRRAVSSVTANIAEGYERFYFKDKLRFYYNSRASLAEVYNFLFIAKDLHYIKEAFFTEIVEKINNEAKLINGLIRSTENKTK